MFRSLILALALAAPFICHADNLDDAIAKYRARRDTITPVQVLDWLKAGNRRFAAGAAEHGGYPVDARERIHASAAGQRPLAVVLSCIDSRTTPELAFDVSVGDVFTARVGANVINDDVLGSLEIAANSGAKVVVIMGHTDCGGVKGAIDNLVLGHATAMLAKVKPAIAAVNARLDADPAFAHEVGERSTQNRRYVAEVAHANARASFAAALAQSPLLREMVDRGEILFVGALFDVDTGEVRWEPVR